MKLKKILALACSLVMTCSMFVATANAAVDGCTATLEFAGYEVKGTTTFAKINVKATIPDTLVPYEMVPADWETTFEDSYKGLMVQSVGFDIPNVAGLTFVSSLSSAAEYVQLKDNKADGKLTIYAANTGSYDTYYAGEVGTLATLSYRITGDVNAAYDVALSDAVIGLVTINEDGSATPKEYTFADFAVTNATVKPAEPEPEPEADPVEVELKESNANGYIWYVEVADEMDAFGAKFYAGNQTAERKIRNIDALPVLDGDPTYKFNVGLKLKTIDSIDKAEFTANGFTATWKAE